MSNSSSFYQDTSPVPAVAQSASQMLTIAQGLITSIMNGTAFGSAYASWFNALPTTLPTTPGQPWNNGGVLSFS